MHRLSRRSLGSHGIFATNRRPVGQRYLSSDSRYFRVSEDVRQALSERRPVIALESTIYTHGFPYPDNIALAAHLESVIRESGGVPATIGVLDGVARVGLDADEIIRLAGAAGRPETLKVSRRDLGFACGLGSPGRRSSGGTTVSGTMVLAYMAGIKVFATGGLGGVHRGAESSMDVSADLTELGRTPVAVISSGCKSFLDIPRTLEYLETEGVPVATFADGRDGPIDLPAFWSRESGIRSPMSVRDESEAAAVIHAQHTLGLRTGLLFANPIPEQYSIPKEEMAKAIETALQEAVEAGAHGSANTPFILAKIKELTASSSVTANRALIESNVRRGTRVAIELLKLERDSELSPPPTPRSTVVSSIVGPAASNYTSSGTSQGIPSLAAQDPESAAPEPPVAMTARSDVFVAGSLAVDLACDYSPINGGVATQPHLKTSNPASISQSLGGVAHNIARAAHLMGCSVRLCSAVGGDLAGEAATGALKGIGLDTQGVRVRQDRQTAQYVALNDANKDLFVAMADMSILSDDDAGTADSATIETIFESFWKPQLDASRPSNIVLDANWSADMLGRWIRAGRDAAAHLSFEPVSTAKAARLFQGPPIEASSLNEGMLVNMATPNALELAAMFEAARESDYLSNQYWWQITDSLGIPSSGVSTQLSLATSPALVQQGIPQQSIQLLPYIPCILSKLGSDGVLLTQLLRADDPRLSDGKYATCILSRCRNPEDENMGVGGIYMRLFPAVEQVPEKDIVSVNGVGDTMLGALVAGLQRQGPDARVEDLVDMAQRAAVLTLKSRESVSPAIAGMKSILG